MFPYLFKWKLLHTIISHFAVLFVLSKTRCLNQFCCLLCHKAGKAAAEVGAVCWLLYMDLTTELKGSQHSPLPPPFCLPLPQHSWLQHNVPVYLQVCDPRARCVSRIQVWMLHEGSMSGCGPESCLMQAPPLSGGPSIATAPLLVKVLSLKGLL